MRVPNSRSRHKDITVKSHHLKILFGIILAFLSLKGRESPSTLLDFVIKIALVRNTIRFLSAVYFRKAPRLARHLHIIWSSILEHAGSATPHIGGASGGVHNCKFCIHGYRTGLWTASCSHWSFRGMESSKWTLPFSMKRPGILISRCTRLFIYRLHNPSRERVWVRWWEVLRLSVNIVFCAWAIR